LKFARGGLHEKNARGLEQMGIELATAAAVWAMVYIAAQQGYLD